MASQVEEAVIVPQKKETIKGSPEQAVIAPQKKETIKGSPEQGTEPGGHAVIVNLNKMEKDGKTEKSPAPEAPEVVANVVLELDDVLRRKAWAVWKKDVNFIKRHFLDEADYDYDIDWSALTIEHRLVKFQPMQEVGTEIESNWGKVITGSRWVPLWGTWFENNSDCKQSHTFRGSRDTTTWVDIDLEQGYTVNGEICVDVNIPPDFRSFCAGRNSSFSVNKIKGQAFKEVLKWEVNSQVEVHAGWQAHAQLLAREECNAVEFEIRTTIGCPKGVLPVKFKKRGDSRVVRTVELKDFKDAFELVKNGGVLLPEEKALTEVLVTHDVAAGGETRTSCLPQVITRGTCVSVSWTDQKVDIATSRLPGQDSPRDGTRDATKSGLQNVQEVTRYDVISF